MHEHIQSQTEEIENTSTRGKNGKMRSHTYIMISKYNRSDQNPNRFGMVKYKRINNIKFIKSRVKIQ